MSYNIFSTSPTFGYYADGPLAFLKSHDCTITLAPKGKKLSETDLCEISAQAEGLIVGLEKITSSVINAGQKLKVIAKHGAGVDNIDMQAATAKGITVICAPGANSDAVADLTFGLFIALARSIPFANSQVKDGLWPRMLGTQLFSKTIGIIGMGQIGKKVARRAIGFDMRVLAYDVFKDDEFARQHEVNYTSLPELLKRSDYISIHIPLTEKTYRLIGERELAMMKREAFLVNISRGDILDESALYSALKGNKLKGAACDVFSSEPPKANPLFELDNFLGTPHMGGYTYEALQDTGMICVSGIVDVINGRKPPSVIK